MDYLLFAIALLTIFAAGIGCALLLLPRTRRTNAIEAYGLAFLFGVAFVSLASFCLGLFLSGYWLQLAITAACLISGAVGIFARWRSLMELRQSKVGLQLDRWALILLTLQFAVVAWASYRLWLGWDALLIWEFKARVAFLSGGSIPFDYFENPTGIWPHTSYPLLLPLAEAWVYSWIGRPDQQIVKLLFPFFYLAALSLLFTGCKRFSEHKLAAELGPLLLFFIPIAWIGEGSASSGYADFPLAVFYLASVIGLIDYWKSEDGESIRLAGALAAIPIWVKDEGVILWGCVVLLAGIKAVRRRSPRELLILIMPGAALLGGWKLFLTLRHAPVYPDFLPVTLDTPQSHLKLIPEITIAVTSEFLRWDRWGIFWPVFVYAAICFIRSSNRTVLAVLFSSVLLPIACYSGVYLFSAWTPVSVHIASSFSRLLLHVVPAGLLFIILAASSIATQGRKEFARNKND